MPLRVLLLSDYYPPFIGGGHRQSQLLAWQLSQRGHSVDVATIWSPGQPTQETDELGVTVHRIKQMRTVLPVSQDDSSQRHPTPFPDPVTVNELSRLITRLKPDVAHSYGWISYSCAAALRGTHVPLLLSVRDHGYGCPTRELMYRGELCNGPALKKCLGCATAYFGAPKGAVAVAGILGLRSWFLSRLNGIHSVSGFVQRMIHRDLVKDRQALLDSQGGKIVDRVIADLLVETVGGRDPEFPARLPSEPFILFVGGLQVRKGILELLDAYQRLSSPPPLVLIGYASPDMPRAFPAGVTVLLDVPHPDVMAAWERCLFGVTPSLWADPLPGVVREAMSKGKPVVGTSAGGITEMILEGETGLLVPPRDVDALAAAIQRLVADRGLTERLGRAAREHVKSFALEAVVPRYEAFYYDSLSLARRN